jgi:succinyl-CoA synthetase beta subunit
MPFDLKKWIENLYVPDRPDEFEVKTILSEYGISVPNGLRLMPDDPPSAFHLNSPFVVKVCSGNIIHKTEHKGVALGIKNAEIDDVIRQFRNNFPRSPILIEEMIYFEGPEFIVGALVDPSFGPAVMVGAGGIFTEIFKDVSFRLAPCPAEEACRMIHELSMAPVFEGFRKLSIDAEGLAAIISKVGNFAADMGDRFSQLDINPIVYTQSGWITLDAKMVLEGESETAKMPSSG